MANLRRELMDELLTTERQYVRDLHILIEVPLSLSLSLFHETPFDPSLQKQQIYPLASSV